jgi:hypothetical protein
MSVGTPNSAEAVNACHDLLLWIIPQLDKLPRVRRFTLGDRIENGLLDVLEGLTDAAYSRVKVDTLRQANLRLDRVRHLWRLAHELKALPSSRSHAPAWECRAGAPRPVRCMDAERPHLLPRKSVGARVESYGSRSNLCET